MIGQVETCEMTAHDWEFKAKGGGGQCGMQITAFASISVQAFQATETASSLSRSRPLAQRCQHRAVTARPTILSVHQASLHGSAIEVSNVKQRSGGTRQCP